MNEVREFQEKDTKDLYPVYRYFVENTDVSLQTKAEDYEAFHERMCKIAEKNPFYVGLADGVILGYGFTQPMDVYTKSKRLTISFVPGKHYGLPTKIIKQLERDCKVANVRWLYLRLSDRDQSSIDFYHDAGYSITGRFPESVLKDDEWLGYVWLSKDLLNQRVYRIASSAVVDGEVLIEKDVSVWHQAVIRGDAEKIEIKEETNVQDGCILHVDEGYPLSIGARVTIGHGAIVHGAMIEDEVLIGMGSIILNGAHIGKHSIIGAGAVVTEGMDVPEKSLVVGCPAKVIKEVSDEQVEHILENAKHYVEESKKSL